MRGGKLDTVIYADKPTDSVDANGAPVRTFSAYARYWGSVSPTNETLLTTGGLLANQTRTTITLRWSPAAALIDPTWRLRARGQVYDIVSALDPDLAGRRVARQFVCESGVTEG